jgi:flagellar basal body-associated protein FliL
MSEETNVPESDGTWSGLKKTIIGVATTAVMAGGTYFTSTLFGGGDKEETKTEQVAPAAPVININNTINMNFKELELLIFLKFYVKY